MSINIQQKFFKITTNSMFPTLKIGDIVILRSKSPEDIKVGIDKGDILILKGPQYFYNKGIDKMLFGNLPNDVPIIHRAIDKKKEEGKWFFKTKGDNSWFPDGSLSITEKTVDYISGENRFSNTIYIPESEVLGVVYKIIPTICDNNLPKSKFLSTIDIQRFEKMKIKAYLKK